MKHRLTTLMPVVRLFGERRNALMAGALLALAAAAAGMALLGLSGWFITATAIAGLAAATINVFTPAATIRLLAIIRTAGRYGERLTTHDVTLGILAALREKLFRGWATPALAWHLRRQPARLLHRLTADIDALESLYLRIAVPAFAAVGATLIAAVMLGSLDIRLGLVAGLWLMGTSLAILLVGVLRGESHARRRAYGIEAIRSRAIDLVAGQAELMMASRLQAQRSALIRADRYVAQADDALNRLDSRLAFAFGAGSTLLTAAVLLAVAAVYGAGRIDAPMAALGLIVVLTATDQFTGLRKGALELGRTLLSARRVGPSLEVTPPAVVVGEPETGKALVIRKATVCHDGAPVAALQAIDLSMAEGEVLALIGPSGAGKSTLLSVLAGEIGVSSGDALHRPATLLTQRTELFEDTIRGNLLLARPSADDAALWEVLAAAGLRQVVEGLPQGLDTHLGEGGSGLSGGQSRRLALARFLLKDAPLWLLDEPTEGLDGATARDVVGRIERQACGKSVLIATHLRREAAFADRLAVMEKGSIVRFAHRGEPDFETALEGLRPD